MNIIVIFAALFAAASAINPAAIYRSQCSEGASYWCQSASHADECGAVEYCIQNSWRGKIVQESSTCSDCEAFINAVHNVLEQTSVQTEIIDGAKQACVVMDSLSGICQTLVETLGAEALQKLVTELNSDEVCKVLQFCQEKTSLQTNVNDGEVCTLCKDGMAEANAILSNVTLQQDFENMLLQFCPLLSEFFPNCANFIQDEIPVVIQFLLTYLNPESCSEIGLCPGTLELQNLLVQLKKMKNRDGVDLCSTCKSTMGTIDTMLKNQAIQGAIVLALDHLCATLGPAAPVCVIAVKQFTPEIIATIVTYLDPDTFCTEFRFCSSVQNAHLGSDFCTDCTTFFGDIDGMLTNQTVQNMIIAAVDDVCAQFGDFADQCKSYVDQYAYLVFDFLASQLSPQEICTDISFCPSTPETKTKAVEKKFLLRGPSKVCTDCEQFFTDLQTKLNDPNVQNTIVNAIENVCSLFGPSADECRSYIEQYGDLVIQFIVSSIDPDTVCNDLGFCMSSARPSIPNLMKKKIQGPSKVCTDCEQFFTDVQTKLNDPNVQNTIINAIENVCTLFGPSADECRSYVDQYGDLVIQFIVSSIDPDTVCNDLGFCMSSSWLSIPNLMKKKIQGPSKVCTDCEQFFTDVQTKLNDPNVQNTIVNAIENVCSLFGPSADECRSYVDQYGDLVIQFIVSSVDPDTVCNDIGFCMSSAILRQKLALTADTCTDCKAFFGDIDSMLMNTTVQNMVTAELLQICSEFGSFADQCKTYVSQYAPLLYTLLASELNPDQICATLTFCPAQMSWKEPRTDNSGVCSLCESVIGAVETYVSSQANQRLIVQELDTVICANLPSILAFQCKSLVKTYTPVVINLMLSYFEPTVICTEVKLCPGASTFKITADPEFCSDCKAFLADIDSLLSNQTFQTEILTQLKGLCAQTGSLEAECQLLIETYGPTLFALILSELDPTTDCTAIGMCPAGSAPIISKMDPQLCSECKTFLADAVAFLSNQTFENEILAQLEGLCKMAGSLQAECVLMVKTYGPAAFAYLQAELDPTTVCTEIGVCPGNSAPVMLLQQAISLPVVQPMATLYAARPIPHKDTSKATDTDCDFCKTIVGLFLPYIEKNATEQEVLNAVAEVCKIFGDTTAERECENYVHTYGSLIFELLINNMSPEEVCKEIGQCASLMDSKPMKHLKEVLSKLPTDGTFCTLCKIGVGELETMLSSNKTKEEIKQEVEKLLCGNLPSPINTQCLSFMEIYGDVLVQLVIDQFEPTTFCAEIGLCDASKQELKTKMPPLETNTECLICEFMISKLEESINENSTENEIRSALDKVCYELPATVRRDCDALVAEYTEKIVAYLLLECKPKVLCTALGICDAAEKIALAKKMEVADQETCILCEYIMSEVDKLLTENSTEAEIQDVLDRVCAELPSHLTGECKDFVDNYTPALLSFLTQELDPKTFCITIGECDGAKLEVKKQQSNIECVICEFVMAELDTILKENATEEAIMTALDYLCALMPSTVRTDCESFVSTYEAILIKLLLSESADQICTTIQLCTSSLKALQGIECDLCQTAVREFMIGLQEPSVTKEVVAIINETCAILPAEYKAECLSYVDQYGDLVTEFIAQFFDPITSCTLLEACPYPDNSPRPPKRLLGQHECTRGPGYWCASMENAKECDMVEHCKRHAWN